MVDDASAAGEEICRLGALSASGAPPDRMVRTTTDVVLRWQDAAEDENELRTWLEALWQSLNEGVIAQEEAAGNLDRADNRSGPVIERILEGLRDSRAVVTAVLERG